MGALPLLQPPKTVQTLVCMKLPGHQLWQMRSWHLDAWAFKRKQSTQGSYRVVTINVKWDSASEGSIISDYLNQGNEKKASILTLKFKNTREKQSIQL